MPTISPIKREISEPKEARRAELTLPKPPGSKLKWEQAEPWLASLTPEQLDCLETYCYRQYPVIVRQLSDSENSNYIDKIPGELSRNYFIEMHGGGNYRLIVKNSTIPYSSNNSQICEIQLKIGIAEAEPKLNIQELDMNHKENKAYIAKLQAENKIGSDGKPPVTNTTKEIPSTTDPIMANMMRDFMQYLMNQNKLQPQSNPTTDLNGSIANIFLEKMKQEDPGKQVATLTTLLQSVKAMVPETPKTEVDMFKIMLDMQSKNQELQNKAQEKQNELMMKIVEMQRPIAKEDDGLGEGSMIEKMKTLMEFAQTLKGGRPAERSVTEMLIDAGTSILPNLLGTINSFMQMRSNSSAMGGFNFPQPAGPTSSPLLPPPENLGQAMPNNNQTSSVPQSNVTQMPQPQPSGTLSQLQGMINQYGGLILQHLVGGTPGNEFAELIVGLVGKPIYNQIAMQKNEDILAAAKSVPEFWSQAQTAGSGSTFGEAYFLKWLDDFRNYEEFLNLDEEEDIEEGKK